MTVQQTRCLQDALEELEAWQDDLPADLQRRFTRFSARGEARLWPGQAGATVSHVPTVHVRDVSRGGVSVLSSRPAEPGAFWQVQLGTDKIAVATHPGVCRYCRDVVPGTWLIGIEFGLDASLLLSLGVPANDLARREERDFEPETGLYGRYVDPSILSEIDLPF